MIKRICVYCGSSSGSKPHYFDVAQQLGKVLLEQNFELVYGGADVGLMGAVANAVLEGGGMVTGVIPRSFADKVSHASLSQLHVVESMHERKAMMYDLSDAFIALPGGFGTLEEVIELITWAQLGFHSKPVGLINVAGFYDRLLDFLDETVSGGFTKQAHRQMLLAADEPAALLKLFEEYVPPGIEKWATRETS